jgi:hypothetical protein
MPEVPGAVAVHLVFAGHGYVVNMGSLKKSMATALGMADSLIELWHAEHPTVVFKGAATLAPLTAQEARVASADGGTFDRRQFREDHALIVRACYEEIRRCEDPEVRVQAARLLQSVEHTPSAK